MSSAQKLNELAQRNHQARCVPSLALRLTSQLSLRFTAHKARNASVRRSPSAETQTHSAVLTARNAFAWSLSAQ